LLEEARPHHQAALSANAKNAMYRRFYRNYLRTLAETRLGVVDHGGLATTAEELARFSSDFANDTYDAACFLCHCAVLAEKDAQLAQPKRKELAENYANRALALLRQAIAHGFKDAAHMKKDSDLEPLRLRDDFKKLVAELEARSKP
jgi:hypothetical protein